jgi:hypothetical protein
MEKNKQDRRLLKRRDFLAKAAVVTAGLAVVSSCASSEQPKEITKGSDKSGGSKMKARKLGSLMVSEIGAGCMSISANYGPPA